MCPRGGYSREYLLVKPLTFIVPAKFNLFKQKTRLW